jgi:hypothetical protein
MRAVTTIEAPISASLVTAIGDPAARSIQSCESCKRHRVGLGPWLAPEVSIAAVPDEVGSPDRLTECRDCLSFQFPEYFVC